jgi:lipocalin-like protein
MIKKFMLISATVLTMAACKKDNKTPLLDITGTWKMTTFDQGQVSATSSQYPCLENNTITISANGTGAGQYTGAAPCVLSNIGGNTGVIVTLGVQGQASTPISWSRNGNNLTFKQTTPTGSVQHFYATIGTENNQLTMHITDTITVGGNVLIEHDTRVKQ